MLHEFLHLWEWEGAERQYIYNIIHFESFVCRSVGLLLITSLWWHIRLTQKLCGGRLHPLSSDIRLSPRWSQIMGWIRQSNEGSGNVLIFPKTIYSRLLRDRKSINEVRQKDISFSSGCQMKDVTCKPKIEFGRIGSVRFNSVKDNFLCVSIS